MKLRAMPLDAEGERDLARGTWLVAAKMELEALIPVHENPAALRMGVGEVIACLTSACTPMLKDKLRAVVGRFMKAVLPT
jgi:hypothetical protein